MTEAKDIAAVITEDYTGPYWAEIPRVKPWTMTLRDRVVVAVKRAWHDIVDEAGDRGN